MSSTQILFNFSSRETVIFSELSLSLHIFFKISTIINRFSRINSIHFLTALRKRSLLSHLLSAQYYNWVEYSTLYPILFDDILAVFFLLPNRCTIEADQIQFLTRLFYKSLSFSSKISIILS